MTANPFLDTDRVRGTLYAEAGRLAQRTTALARAKTAGRHPAAVIAELAADGPRGTVLDIGCGRGTTTVALAERLDPPKLIAFDQSAALLTDAQRRLAGRMGVRYMRGDFHAIALPDASVAVAAAAFCLYHSPEPAAVIAEIARCLAPGGLSITVTKSADSYAQLDDVIAASGLDPDAAVRPSLYETFHSHNQADIVGTHLDIREIIHHQHRFRFTDADHIAAYAATNPKYQLTCDERGIAERLRQTVGDGPLETASTVTYVVAVRR